MVIAAAVAPASLDPAAGYAPLGAAKIYDGLVEYQPGGTLRPALAAGLPVPAADGRSWTVTLRGDVKFHDGSAFDADDVVATYRRVLDGPLRSKFWMLSDVRALDAATVRFELSQPYPAFTGLLVLGVKPVAEGTNGTGPYQVTAWEPGRKLVLKAHSAYYLGAPKLSEVTVEFVPDDETRAQLLRDGKLDGAALPATLASGFATTSGLTVVDHAAGDVRMVSLPDGPVTGDPAMRRALNLVVDRRELVKEALAGKGVATSVPLPAALAEFAEPGARFDLDVSRAKALLEAAGWSAAADGQRAKAGVPAVIPVGYPVGDLAARDLIAGFARAAATVGVKVTAEPVARDALTGATAELRSVGDPFDPSRALSWLGDTEARAVTDPAQRAVAYRALTRAYLAAPSAVVLAETGHSYVIRQNWTGYRPVVDGPGTDHTWGAWWNLQTWAPR
ncbi:peptide/nickel transport system substrate-binding protein [Actinokineospora alba]|uniref:Peptide/nickel transport system substrate-binding protein n=2 Tax=Actinokineospora alba TaxID=504798 RepID=A0A1H0MUJ4_9PSEU|nr:peptide/nickel transport system substrate-binding protein [Actinokineospora alba]SDO84093.1 peptide/nickel transport system substrate-binding protein [Actinokineospora alba]